MPVYDYDIFICHASEDKSPFVRPLAHALKEKGLKVFYDEMTIKWGDSLRQKIDEGLLKSRYGIVILSRAFFKKKWPQWELDGLITRQMRGKKVILPIRHNISTTEIEKYSPSLANIYSLHSDLELKEIVTKTIEIISTNLKVKSGIKTKISQFDPSLEIKKKKLTIFEACLVLLDEFIELSEEELFHLINKRRLTRQLLKKKKYGSIYRNLNEFSDTSVKQKSGEALFHFSYKSQKWSVMQDWMLILKKSNYSRYKKIQPYLQNKPNLRLIISKPRDSELFSKGKINIKIKANGVFTYYKIDQIDTEWRRYSKPHSRLINVPGIYKLIASTFYLRGDRVEKYVFFEVSSKKAMISKVIFSIEEPKPDFTYSNSVPIKIKTNYPEVYYQIIGIDKEPRKYVKDHIRKIEKTGTYLFKLDLIDKKGERIKESRKFHIEN